MNGIKTETKVCKICNEEKELSEFYSQKHYSKTKGEWHLSYQGTCKECISKKNKENSKENYRREKEYRQKNPEASRKSSRKWNEKNKDKIIIDQKQWRQINKDKTKEYNEKYKVKQFKLSTKEWNACKNYFNHCCSYCGISEIKAKQKYSKGLHKEHAINNGNNDLSNCLVACTGCNSSKREDDYTLWYTKDNPVYDEGRMNLIEKWLDEEHKKFIKIHNNIQK